MSDELTFEKLQKFAEKNWLRVDATKRDKCVWHLRKMIPIQDQHKLKRAFAKNDFGGWFHFSGGMAVRNMLRDVMKDDELPGVKYSGDNLEFRNWDDFYMAALRQAVAPKEGEV